jgi:hypothetical protein
MAGDADAVLRRSLGPVATSVATPAVQWLSRWLLFGGTGALVLAAAAFVLALLHGIEPVSWHGAVLSFDCAVVVLVLRAALLAGVPARSLCHIAFAGLGLVVSAFSLLSVFVRSVLAFIHGAPPTPVLTDLLIFGLLAVAGCTVAVQCIRRTGWACRTAVVSAVVFLLLFARQMASGSAVFGRRIVAAGLPGPGFWLGLVATAACAGAFAMTWDGRSRGPRRCLATVAWLSLLSVAAVLLAVGTVQRAGLTPAYTWLWVASVAWNAVALLPPVAAGLLLAWHMRRALSHDIVEATGLLWVLVVLGGLMCLALWLPSRALRAPVELLIVSAGVLTCMVAAWLGASRGDWVSRWAFVPATGLTAGVLCAIGQLLERASSTGPLWMAVTAFLWSSLGVGMALASAGLAWRRRAYRERGGTRVRWGDAELLATIGAAAALVLLWLIFAHVNGTPHAVTSLDGVLAAFGAHVQDALTLSVGAPTVNLVRRAAGAAAQDWSQAATLSVGGVALVVLALHALAGARIRWAVPPVACLWSLAAACATVGLILWTSRLFFPLAAPGLVTGPGRRVAAHFPARLLLTVGFMLLVIRLWEALLSTLRLWPGRRAAPATFLVVTPEELDAWPADPNFVFLTRLGLMLGSVGLALALVLYPSPWVSGMLVGLGAVGRTLAADGLALTQEVGHVARAWPGYGLAAGLALLAIVAISYEARAGRVAAYPVLAACWTLVLCRLAVLWIGNAVRSPANAPGRWSGHVAAGVVLAALVAATARLWSRWWHLAGKQPFAAGGARDPEATGSSTFGMGSLGIALALAGAAALLHAACSALPPYAAAYGRVLARTGRMAEAAVSTVAAKAAEWRDSERAFTACMAAVVSASWGALHLAARRRSRNGRALLLAVWSGVIGAGSAGLLRAVTTVRPGGWTLGGLGVLLLASLLLVRSMVAVLAAPRWLTPRPSPASGRLLSE